MLSVLQLRPPRRLTARVPRLDIHFTIWHFRKPGVSPGSVIAPEMPCPRAVHDQIGGGIAIAILVLGKRRWNSF